MVDRNEYSPVRDIYREGALMDRKTKQQYEAQEKVVENNFRAAQPKIMFSSKFNKSEGSASKNSPFVN